MAASTSVAAEAAKRRTRVLISEDQLVMPTFYSELLKPKLIAGNKLDDKEYSLIARCLTSVIERITLHPKLASCEILNG